MGALPHPPLLTIEEFDRLEPPEGVEYELIEGVLHTVTFPRPRHAFLQFRIADLLKQSSAAGGPAVELGFEIPEVKTKCRADVAFLSEERRASLMRGNVSQGAPDLVVEVISPSNRRKKLHRLAELCLRHGCCEFWVVDADHLTVTVLTLASTATYAVDDTIPRNELGIGPIQVNAIFEELLPLQD